MCCGLNCVFLKFRCGVLTPVPENMTLFGNKVVVDVISYGEVDDGLSSSTTVSLFFIYLFWLGLRCFMGYSLVTMHGLLLLWSMGSRECRLQ